MNKATFFFLNQNLELADASLLKRELLKLRPGFQTKGQDRWDGKRNKKGLWYEKGLVKEKKSDITNKVKKIEGGRGKESCGGK